MENRSGGVGVTCNQKGDVEIFEWSRRGNIDRENQLIRFSGFKLEWFSEPDQRIGERKISKPGSGGARVDVGVTQIIGGGEGDKPGDQGLIISGKIGDIEDVSNGFARTNDDFYQKRIY